MITDSRGQAISGASVSLQNLDTGAEQKLSSGSGSSDGSFLAPLLAPGGYAVSIGAPGFRDETYPRVEVPLGQTFELRTTLHSAWTPPFARLTAIAAPGSKPPPTALLEDTQDRRWQDLALLTPDALPDANDDGLLSVHGLAATENSSLIDGADNNQSFGSVPVGTGSDPAPDAPGNGDAAAISSGPGHGLARGRRAGAPYSFSPSAIRAFRVASGGYTAQTGRAGGGVVSAVSRSGTTVLHGSLFLVARSSALAARNSLSIATTYTDGLISSAVIKPHDLRENFGGTLGGAVPRIRQLFFFYTFDGQRRGFPAISSPADPNFFRLTTVQRALLATRGVREPDVNAALNYLSSLTGPTARGADQNLNFVRLDWQPRPRLQLSLDENRVRWNSPAGLIDAPVVARGRNSLGNSAGSLDGLHARLTSTFSPHLLNQVRLQYARDLQYETAQPNLPQEPGIGPGGLAPEVNIGPNGLIFGTPSTVAKSAYPDERRLEAADTMTLVRGSHLLEVGADVSFVDDRVATLANSAGTFLYDSATRRGFAGGLVDFITDSTFNVNTTPNGGCPAITAPIHLFCFRSFSQSFGEDRVQFATQEWAGFVEDAWRPHRAAHSGLTLHFGVRYEYTLLPLPQRPNAALDAVFGARGATSRYPEDRNNFGPRAAIAYEPFGAGRGTVRLGFGLFFGRLAGATIRGALADTAQPSSTTRIRLTPVASVLCPQVPNQGFGFPCSFLATPTGTVARTTSAMILDRRFRLPVIEQGSVSFEREVFRRTTLSVGYVVNSDRQLPGSVDLNIAPSTHTGTFRLRGGTGAPGVRGGETFVLPVYTARITPMFGPVTDIVSNANATYHGLVVSLQSQVIPSFTFRANYTWSKAIDYAQSSSAIPRTNGQFDPFTNGYDKGLSSLNYPAALHVAAVWSPQVESSSRSLRLAISGWELVSIFTARSGRPYSYDLFGGTRLPGGHESLNGSGGALYLPTVGRNTLRLPAIVNEDLRISRSLSAGSRVRVKLSAEAYNVLNQQHVSSVNQRAYVVGAAVAGVTPLTFQDAPAIALEGRNTRPFGAPTATGSSLARERQIQTTLQVTF